MRRGTWSAGSFTLFFAAISCLVAVRLAARTQAANAAAQPRAVSRTLYTRTTELFAEWRPFIVGEPTRLTAHLTQIGDRFRPFTEARITLTLAIEGSTVNAAADAPERPGVFRLNLTAPKEGLARVVIDVESSPGRQHFVLEDVPVYASARAALAKEVPEEAGLISYPKERSWEEEFSTAPVTVHFPGAGAILTVPTTALVRVGATVRVYVQRTPERFELREVKTRRTIGTAIEIVSGLREGERVVVIGADKKPRPD